MPIIIDEKTSYIEYYTLPNMYFSEHNLLSNETFCYSWKILIKNGSKLFVTRIHSFNQWVEEKFRRFFIEGLEVPAITRPLKKIFIDYQSSSNFIWL